jgi:outer membrane protein assembly factor BamB
MDKVEHGKLIWRTDTRDLLSPLISDSRIYPYGFPMVVGSTAIIKVGFDSVLVGIDIASGNVKWVHTASDPILHPACNVTNLYYVSRFGQCSCIDISTGQFIRKGDDTDQMQISTFGHSGLIVGDYYLAGFDGSHTLVAFNVRDCRAEWDYVGPSDFTTSPIFIDGRLVIGCKDGYVYCFASE